VIQDVGVADLTPGSPTRRPRWGGIRVLSLLCACSVIAPPANAEWTVAALLGAAQTTRSSLILEQPPTLLSLVLAPIDYQGASFESPIYYAVRIAHVFGFAPMLSIEGEFIHMKVFAETTRRVSARGTLHGVSVDGPVVLADVVQRFSLSHGLNMVLGNVAVSRRFGQDRVSPFLKVAARGGVGPTVPHAESTVRGRSREGYELGALAFQGSTGIEVRVTKRVYAVGDYKFTRTRQRVGIADGQAETLISTHHLVFGAGFRF